MIPGEDMILFTPSRIRHIKIFIFKGRTPMITGILSHMALYSHVAFENTS